MCSIITSTEDTFLSNTNYEQLVGLKKLKFIFSAISSYLFKINATLEKLSILEIGCGNGNITVPLGSLGCLVRSFDINEKAVAKLKTMINEKKFQNVVVSVDDGYTFDDGKHYDIVIASEVLEHLEDPFRFLTNISKRMNKGSYFIVTVPNSFGPWELRNRLFGRRLYYCNFIRRMGLCRSCIKTIGQEHLQFYRKPQLVDMLSRFSFNLIDFSNSDSFFATLWAPFLKPIKQLERVDIKLADVLPYWCASGWFLLFEKHQK